MKTFERLLHFESKDFEIRKEFCSLIGELTEDERSGLTQQLKEQGGTRDAMVVGEWMEAGSPVRVLVDGHNRLEICQAEGLTWHTKTIRFEGESDAKVWMIQNQLARRNITTGQRAALADELARNMKQRHQKRHPDQKLTDVGELRSDLSDWFDVDNPPTKAAADAAGVSSESLRKARAVRKEGAPEDYEAMRSGDINLETAYRRTRPTRKSVPTPEPAEKPEDAIRPPEWVSNPPAHAKAVEAAVGIFNAVYEEGILCGWAVSGRLTQILEAKDRAIYIAARLLGPLIPQDKDDDPPRKEPTQ